MPIKVACVEAGALTTAPDCSESIRAWLVNVTGLRTVPQIFINDEPIGGFHQLRDLDRTGELDKKLAQTAA